MFKRLQLRKLAIAAKEAKFFWHCARHGFSEHDTHLGSCTLCHLEQAHQPPRLRALNTGGLFYLDTCAVHGPAEHHTKKARCSLCFDSRGRSLAGKEAGLSARARARRAGETTYRDTCARHGETVHSVLRGKCLTCFTSAGTPRQYVRVPVPPL